MLGPSIGGRCDTTRHDDSITVRRMEVSMTTTQEEIHARVTYPRHVVGQCFKAHRSFWQTDDQFSDTNTARSTQSQVVPDVSAAALRVGRPPGATIWP